MFLFFNTIFSPEMATEDQEKATRIVLELLDAGAHTDFVNKYGQSPYTGYLSGNGYILLKRVVLYF